MGQNSDMFREMQRTYLNRPRRPPQHLMASGPTLTCVAGGTDAGTFPTAPTCWLRCQRYSVLSSFQGPQQIIRVLSSCPASSTETQQALSVLSNFLTSLAGPLRFQQTLSLLSRCSALSAAVQRPQQILPTGSQSSGRCSLPCTSPLRRLPTPFHHPARHR